MSDSSHRSDNWDVVREIFEESIPFHKFLDLKVSGLDTGSPALFVDHKDMLVGNFVRGNIHGGVISCLLDVIGGIVAFLEVINRRKLKDFDSMLEQFSRMGTIDMRVDYLRPGYGKRFVATGYVLRIGNKVAVTRMELHNEENLLIAVGTGAYVIG